MTMHHHPCPWTDHTTCSAARDAYLRENGWTPETYDAPTTTATVLGFDVAIPNTETHRWAIRLHDLHHVATGYGTDATGEAEISAWELAGGLGRLDAYVSSLVFAGALYGLVHSPLRTLRAFRRGRRVRSLFFESRQEEAYQELLGLSVAQLRSRLGVETSSLRWAASGRERRRLHARAPRAA